MPFKIRRATKKDIPFLLACEDGPNTSHVHGDTAEIHAHNLQNSDCIYLIAEDIQSHPLGFVLLVHTDAIRTELRRMIIATPNQGVGKAFLLQVIEETFKTQTEIIWLDVYEENTRAMHVYRALGFEETYREPSPKDPRKTLVYMALEQTDQQRPLFKKPQ